MSKAVEIAAVQRLVEMFDARVMVSRDTRPENHTAAGRLTMRVGVDERVASCTACGLRDGCTAPITPSWAPARLGRPGRVAVVAEAPSIEEDRKGECGVGRVAGILYAALRHGGLPAEMVTWINAVACTPWVEGAGGQSAQPATRPPRDLEVATCRANVLAALDAADVDYVLLLGAAAVRSWRPDLAVTKVAGGWYLWGSRWFVYPVVHTNAMLRGDSTEAREWQRQIAGFCELVANGTGLEGLGVTCVEADCRGSVYGYDADGVPWCDVHFGPGWWASGKRDRGRKTNDTLQGRML